MGDAYMIWGNNTVQPPAQKENGLNDVWYPDTLATREETSILSKRSSSDVCTLVSGSVTGVPALHMTLPTYTPPFHLEPEACYTPPSAVAALTPYGLGAMALVLGFGSYLMVRRPQAA